MRERGYRDEIFQGGRVGAQVKHSYIDQWSSASGGANLQTNETLAGIKGRQENGEDGPTRGGGQSWGWTIFLLWHRRLSDRGETTGKTQPQSS